MSLLLARQAQTFNVTLSGTIAPSGSLLKKNVLKILSGTVTPAGTLLKSSLKLLSGAISPAGTLMKQTLKLLVGGVAPAGTLRNTSKKLLSGNLTTLGALAANKLITTPPGDDNGVLTDVDGITQGSKIS